jgi:hypothetical protein
MVSAGLVHQPSAEASLGTLREPLLAEAARITGGNLLKGPALPELGSNQATQHIELWPPMIVALLLLFLVDVGIRRWEHVQALWQRLRQVIQRYWPGRT